MISAPNLLQQLNGNNMRAIILYLSLFLLASCSGTKKGTTSRSKTVKPTKRTTTKNTAQRGTGKVDTIYWTEIDRTKEYEKTIEDLDLEKRQLYNVVMFLPLELESASINDANIKESELGTFTQFYAGSLLALKQLESEGVRLDVRVMDSESGKFEAKLQDCRDADMIIGPRNTEQLKVTANFGKINEIPVISPWKSGSKLSKDNPYFIQLPSGQKDHYNRIVEHAKSEFRDDQIFLLGRKKKKDLAYMGYLQSVAAAINQNGNPKPLKEFYIEEDSLRIAESAFDSIFFKDRTSVFILPNWSFREDEEFVYNTVRKMSGEKGLMDVVLYGMPILLESDKVNFEHYRNLRMRICRSSYVDRSAPKVQNFIKNYFANYDDFPSEEAFEGFDALMFLGRQINQYGKKFQYFLDNYEQELIQTEYDVQKVFKPNAGDSFDDIQYFQNKHLYILTFEKDKFVAN